MHISVKVEVSQIRHTCTVCVCEYLHILPPSMNYVQAHSDFIAMFHLVSLFLYLSLAFIEEHLLGNCYCPFCLGG
jgi:hypothetical protein